jgi:hypothetical protein
LLGRQIEEEAIDFLRASWVSTTSSEVIGEHFGMEASRPTPDDLRMFA